MSRVTNVIITTSAAEDEKATELNAACPWNDCVPFQHVPSSHVAGDKNLECNIFTGAFNYLDVDALIRSIASVPWEYPEEVQLFVKGQEDERFKPVEYDFTERAE